MGQVSSNLTQLSTDVQTMIANSGSGGLTAAQAQQVLTALQGMDTSVQGVDASVKALDATVTGAGTSGGAASGGTTSASGTVKPKP